VDNGSVMALYQPIVDLRRDRILGWEALCRGPEKSYFRSPSVLFDFAEDSGLLFSLEKACRDAAIRNLGNLDEGQKLFLNIHPRTLVDPHFSPGETVKLLAEHGLEPGNVVFEITERHSVREFTLFHRTLEHYRDQGFGVAIDDTGTGYSGLQSIAEIRPDFVKIDMGFVRDVDKDPVKRALIETFVALADKIGCRLVAEGIETGPELAALAEMGVHFGQGYYLARPKVPKPEVTLSGAHHLMVRNLSGLRELKCSIPIADLAEAAYTVAPHHKVSEVKELLGGDDPISSVVVADSGGRPLGLVMSHHLDRALSTRYGVSLYYHKPVIRIMDEAPLVVEAQTPVELVARKAMNRDKYKLYDHIVVTENGRVGGLASVQRILDTLALVQVEMARGANPLTGLPGNVAIERELGRRAAGDEPFAIIYADVDNFKAYNDTYGFRSGDNVLLMLAKILSWASRRHGDGVGDMVGHLGGDDFMLITSPERAERVCKGVVRCFSRLVRAFYSDEDLALGYVQSKDRNGRTRRFPMLSLSLAVVDCLGGCDPEEIGRRAAEMKTYAKSLSGNCHVRDRRGRVGPKRE
jgi:EAL domain-containing protein (putative c-di-GMP-specific phosphodiesterase class I)/GGDEF domain-containing protein